MEKNELFEQKVKPWRLKNVMIVILAAGIFLAIHVFTPMLVIADYQNKGYTFPKDTAYINQYSYQKRVEDPNLDILFDEETIIHTKRIIIDEKQYEIIYTDASLFEIGMIETFFSANPVSLYPFHFLHGRAFSDDDGIVISESVSTSLFGKIDSVGETIVIHDIIYTVEGVVKEESTLMNYIYVPISEMDTNDEDVIESLGIILFKDEDIHMSLYERGGIELVYASQSLKNQPRIHTRSGIITNMSFIIVSFISLFISNIRLKEENVRKRSYLKGPQEPFFKVIVASYSLITFTLLNILFFIVSAIAARSSFEVSMRYVFDQIEHYDYVLLIYLVPIMLYLLRALLISLYSKRHTSL